MQFAQLVLQLSVQKLRKIGKFEIIKLNLAITNATVGLSHAVSRREAQLLDLVCGLRLQALTMSRVTAVQLQEFLTLSKLITNAALLYFEI